VAEASKARLRGELSYSELVSLDADDGRANSMRDELIAFSLALPFVIAVPLVTSHSLVRSLSPIAWLALVYGVFKVSSLRSR
jgi:hypothetical protein